MSASKSVDANILIVSGFTRQFGQANLAASGIICFGIVVAFSSGVLTLWLVIALNAASLVAQMLLIVLARARLLKGIRAEDLELDGMGTLTSRAWRAWRSQMVEATVIRTDSILLMTQASVQVVGLYAVVALIPQMSYQVYQTLIQHSFAAAPLIRMRERTRILWQVCLMISLPMSAMAAAAAFLLIPILFGPEFTSSLDWLLPACMIAIGLAGLAPVMQHYAISRQDNWFPILLLGGVAVSVLSGSVVGVPTGLFVLAASFLFASCCYVYLVAGPKMFRMSLRSLRSAFGA
ncbi:hypothetical protein [Paenarthrobacter nitroguajacolicus]